MANFRFELNRAGVKELLNSGEMASMINETAGQVLGRCPDGLYAMKPGKTSQRVKATVGTQGIRGSLDNKRNNTLLKALGGGG